MWPQTAGTEGGHIPENADMKQKEFDGALALAYHLGPRLLSIGSTEALHCAYEEGWNALP